MKIKLKLEWVGALVLILILGLVLLLGEKEEAFIPDQVEVKAQVIQVYINGAVHKPGVYELGSEDRLQVLVERAGGFLDKADIRMVNLARPLKDGEMVWIYLQEEEGPVYMGIDYFNYASKEDLLKLPGIGQTTADKIIMYREEFGAFDSIEDLLEVEGIGQSKLDTLKDHLNMD